MTRLPGDDDVVPATLSATVLLVRDRAGRLEVFMVERHRQIEFATGALVFPGGKADPEDAVAAGGDAARTVRVTAIRETFEECGVLLARERGASALVAGDRFDDLVRRYRKEVHDGTCSFRTLLEREDLVLELDPLVPFSHWITPEPSPRRYDTHFFLVPAPPEQLAAHDGVESVDSLWITPDDALAAAQAGTRTVVFPTRRNLWKLGRSASVAEAVAAARSTPVVTVQPFVAEGPNGPVLRLPEGAGYDVTELPLAEALGQG